MYPWQHGIWVMSSHGMSVRTAYGTVCATHKEIELAQSFLLMVNTKEVQKLLSLRSITP